MATGIVNVCKAVVAVNIVSAGINTAGFDADKAFVNANSGIVDVNITKVDESKNDVDINFGIVYIANCDVNIALQKSEVKHY